MIITIFSILFLLVLSTSAEDNCSSILLESPLLSTNFSHRIAHGIHSLTLEDIQFFFNPNATESNNIPVVNKNLSSRIPILENAPKKDVLSTFKTLGLRTAEEVMSHMGDEKWDLGNSGVLGKLIHALHMQEMWMETSIVYNKIIENSPPAEELCSCLTDVENNGIYFHLRQIAMLIREPELAYNTGNKRLPREGRARGQYHGNYNSGTYNGKAQLQLARLKKREAIEDVPVDPFMKTKEYWMDVLDGFKEDMSALHQDLALYMYC